MNFVGGLAELVGFGKLLWLELPIQITGTWWCDKRIEVLT